MSDYICVNENSSNKISLHKTVLTSIVTETVNLEKKVALTSDALGKSVTTKINNNELNLSVEINVKPGTNVAQACEDLQENVFNAIYQMTGIKCYAIDIRVKGFIF